jgi:hypothetical protein
MAQPSLALALALRVFLCERPQETSVDSHLLKPYIVIVFFLISTLLLSLGYSLASLGYQL